MTSTTSLTIIDVTRHDEVEDVDDVDRRRCDDDEEVVADRARVIAEEDDDVVDDADVELALDEVLAETILRTSVPEDDDEAPVEIDPTLDAAETILPKQDDEFRCKSCRLLKKTSQLADRSKHALSRLCLTAPTAWRERARSLAGSRRHSGTLGNASHRDVLAKRGGRALLATLEGSRMPESELLERLVATAQLWYVRGEDGVEGFAACVGTRSSRRVRRSRLPPPEGCDAPRERAARGADPAASTRYALPGDSRHEVALRIDRLEGATAYDARRVDGPAHDAGRRWGRWHPHAEQLRKFGDRRPRCAPRPR